MKKQLLTIGLFIILVCVGLSGCNSLGITSIKDIQEHRNRYINQTVIITGTYGYSDTGIIAIFDTGMVTDESGKINIMIPNNVKQPTPFVQFGTKYRFTGIVRYGGMYAHIGSGIYLEIIKIETT